MSGLAIVRGYCFPATTRTVITPDATRRPAKAAITARCAQGRSGASWQPDSLRWATISGAALRTACHSRRGRTDQSEVPNQLSQALEAPTATATRGRTDRNEKTGMSTGRGASRHSRWGQGRPERAAKGDQPGQQGGDKGINGQDPLRLVDGLGQGAWVGEALDRQLAQAPHDAGGLSTRRALGRAVGAGVALPDLRIPGGAAFEPQPHKGQLAAGEHGVVAGQVAGCRAGTALQARLQAGYVMEVAPGE